MSETLTHTPVLFLIFNRPDTTQQVFNEIRKAQPAQLFIAADGPRKDRPADQELCKKTREILQQVDWDCKVFTRFQDKNLGCKIGVSSAIDWFFSNVEEGIILEDDCVPDQSFFPFCQELLGKYRDDERVMMIAGTNYLFLKYEMEESYFFSKYYNIWGWATWKRAWKMYDIKMSDWPKNKKSNQLGWIYSDKYLINWYNFMFQWAYDDKIDTWDIQWWYSCIFQNGLCIVPKYNLISNIGEFGHFSRGGSYNEYIRMPTKPVDNKKMIHPLQVIENGIFDRITVYKLVGEKSKLHYKIKGKVTDYFNKIKEGLTQFK